MDRLFSVLLLAGLLMTLPARACMPSAQPVFFSMLFPQLTLDFDAGAWEATAGEAVLL